MLRRMAVVTTLLLVTAVSSASAAVSKGTCLFAVQLSAGTADLYSPPSGGYISAYDHSETGAQGQFWKLLSDDYAFAIGGGIGWFSEKDEPGTGAPLLATDVQYTQSSWHVRLGGDRVVNVGDRGALYFGPGVEFWSGKAKFEGGGTTIETQNVNRISLSGRLGGIMTISPGFGLALEMGHKIGRASAEDEGAKATWWPSSLDANGGIVFLFGK